MERITEGGGQAAPPPTDHTGPYDWLNYRRDQLARREVRRRDRLGGLMEHLPPGYSVAPVRWDYIHTPAAPSRIRIWGYGFELLYDPTHGTILCGKDSQDNVEVWRLVRFLEDRAFGAVLGTFWRLVLWSF